MDYEKAYKETIDKLRKLHNDWNSTQNRAAKEIESAFPELRESEDDNIYSLWKFDIWNGNYSIIWGNKREKFNSYEQAVEAALLYVLKNLI